MLLVFITHNVLFILLEGDQIFLSRYVYSLAKLNSIAHDSYSCAKFGGTPFPTKRKGNCFVGDRKICNSNRSFTICPMVCRPKNHTDWNYC